jgi:aminomethyltransferase
MSEGNLKLTPLNSVHKLLGGKMVDFGGWEMPVQYPTGVIEEHMRTRTAAGLFDVSHMGEIWVEGPDSVAFVNLLTTNDVSKLVDGQAHYSALLNEEGGVIDDLLVYRFSAERLLLVVNAGTTEKDWHWIQSRKGVFDVRLRNASEDYCQIALQGPASLEIASKLTSVDLRSIRYYHFAEGEFAGVESIISRTGYTGEDGFEIYAEAGKANHIWNALMEAGQEHGLVPCGLAARNTLRLEAGMSLYGHELGDDISPLEAGLSWICKIDKGDFIGREALVALRDRGLKRKLVGFEMTGKGIGRDGYDVKCAGRVIGTVSSGSPAPFLKKNIGLAFVESGFEEIGKTIEIDVRGKDVEAVVVPTPFYKRKK